MFKDPTFALPCACGREIWRTRHWRMVQSPIPRWWARASMWPLICQARSGALSITLLHSVGLVELLYEGLDPEIHHLLGMPESLQAGADRRSATLP